MTLYLTAKSFCKMSTGSKQTICPLKLHFTNLVDLVNTLDNNHIYVHASLLYFHLFTFILSLLICVFSNEIVKWFKFFKICRNVLN